MPSFKELEKTLSQLKRDSEFQCQVRRAAAKVGARPLTEQLIYEAGDNPNEISLYDVISERPRK